MRKEQERPKKRSGEQQQPPTRDGGLDLQVGKKEYEKSDGTKESAQRERERTKKEEEEEKGQCETEEEPVEKEK